MDDKNNNLQEIITQALRDIKLEVGPEFSMDKINLADLERRTGISRKKLRNIQSNGFVVKEHGNKGRKTDHTKLYGFTGIIDDYLRKSMTNATVIYDRIRSAGYQGKLTIVKEYVRDHRDLIPAQRQMTSPQGNRGRRYSTGPGECYQMDWGFVRVETGVGSSYKAACFAMICHCCGKRFCEFFPNATQENLFIGMMHGFQNLGIPENVLTDNMKSVTTGRDEFGKPIWNKEYAVFMNEVGFTTKLCKPRHPFTKGAVERFVRFIKDNFIAGRIFGTYSDLNCDALNWCHTENAKYHRCVDCIPNEGHASGCMKVAHGLEITDSSCLICIQSERYHSTVLYPMRDAVSASPTGTRRKHAACVGIISTFSSMPPTLMLNRI